MHFLRLLRIFIPLLLVAAIVAGVVVVLTSRNELQSSRRDVEDTWKPLRSGLDERYGELAVANSSVKSVPGPLHAISTKVSSAEADWHRVEQSGSVSSQVNAANSLESLGRRLVIASRAAPRLVGQTAALSAIATYAGLQPPTTAGAFNAAVDRFENERTRPAKSVAARILGYDSIPAYSTTGSTGTT
jgi:hypothetical protein